MQIPIIPIPQPVPDLNLIVSPKSAQLQVGDIVQAEVLTVTDTAVAIRMKNTILEARTNVPLKEGEVITLAVEGRGDELRLRLIRGREEDSGSIKNTILSALNTLKGLKPAAEDVKFLTALIGSMPQALKEMLPGMSALEKLMISLEGLSGGILKNAVQDSGVYFETKLRLLVLGAGQDDAELGQKLQALMDGDMKAALLSLKSSLGNNEVRERLIQSGVRADILTATVDNLLKNMEALQLQSRLSDTLQVFVPFVWQDLKDGELIFRESKQDRPGEEACSCTLNLDLERAGRLSARVLLRAGQIYVDVFAESERFTNLLQEGAVVLRDQFETAGITLGGLVIRHQPQVDFKMSRTGGLDIRI